MSTLSLVELDKIDSGLSKQEEACLLEENLIIRAF